MANTERDTSPGRTGSKIGAQPRLPRVVDWLVAGVVVVAGVALALGGAGLLLAVDPALVADLVADGTLQSDVLTGQELVDVTVATAWWSGVGLLVAGAGTALGGVGHLVVRRRERARETGGAPARGTWTSAIPGAVTAVVLSFVPFSPVLGGGAAAYLQRGDRNASLRVGGLSGALAVLPLAVAVAFLLAGLVVGALDAGNTDVAVLGAALIAVSTLFTVLLSAALGAVGGLLGARIAGDE